MGQNTSRPHEPSARPASPSPTTNPNPVAGASADPHANDAELSTSGGSGSRRSSLRKNIFKYVKPNNVRDRLGSTLSKQRKESGRSWRSPGQCYKAPVDSSISTSDSHLASSSNNSVESPPSSLPADKGKQREITQSIDDEDCISDSAGDDEHAFQLSNAVTTSEQNISSVSGSSHSVDDALPDPLAVNDISSRDLHSPEEIDSGLPVQESSPLQEWAGRDNVAQSEPQLAPSSQQSNDSSPRSFPPPGTLVVVQGIVHTTDVSRDGGSPSVAHSSADTPIPAPSDSLPPLEPETVNDQSRNRARNRLSALLRPRSATSQPRSVLTSESVPAVTETIFPEAESATFPPSVSHPPQVESNHVPSGASDQRDTSNGILPAVDNAAPSAGESRPSISSSSIDVLGTLLSVAAAATAASLLTGSSEPILSSGLAPPGSNPSVASSIPSSSHPTTSTSLPNVSSSPSLPFHNAGIPDVTAAGRAERMRQAWSTIRERLGLRPSVPQPGTENLNGSLNDSILNNSTPPLSDGDTTTTGAPPDTRELMLAEMARAFNIGLGLNGLTSITPNVRATSTSDEHDATAVISEDTAEHSAAPSGPGSGIDSQSGRNPGNSSVTMPPEGSFERFLVDLQIDLRTALTRTENDADSNEGHQREPQNTTSPGADDDETTLPSALQLPLLVNTENGSRQVQNTEATEVVDDTAYAEMPPLQEISDSESEFDVDDQEGNSDDDDDLSVVHGSNGAASPSYLPNEPSQPSRESGRIDESGRINWWRLYRFPPVPSSRSGYRQPSNLTPQMASSTLESEAAPSVSVPTPGLSTNLLSTDPLDSDSIPLSLPSPPQSSSSQGQVSIGDTSLSRIPLHAVVPVIVVGLQSVNQDWRHDHPPPMADESLDPATQSSTEDVNGSFNDNLDQNELNSLGFDRHSDINAAQASVDSQRGTPRARGWQSRAANAIRNLRSGRRNAETASDIQVPLMTPGSRTFLIYVIGGYYPPDHSIVTGGPNILDSFEALLELADLLGQVKPPTVSKEEIEKSGLKIVKASQLDKLEKQSEVASNCLDRCLICLDDYDAEDSIRIMSCRHAFHRGCVDEWLQKGRNNCPACRSTGVATNSHSPSSVPAATS